MKHLFDNIRPYTEQETLEAVKRLFTDPKLIQQLSIFKDKIDINEWVKKILDCRKRHQIYLTFAEPIFNYFVEKTCSQIYFTGIDNINPNNQYLFIGNHRDIILDSVFLQIYYFRNGYEATRSAVGDNLISSPLLVELARIHQMFLVQRSGTREEKIKNTHLLSSYIHHSIFEEKESVWISQGNGRTKNGDDKTQQGLLKMLTLASPKNAMLMLKEMQITPVVISYQFEPCAKLKARELALSEDVTYIKQPGEDTHSITEGITGYKGEVRFAIGKPLQQEIDEIPNDLSLNDKLTMLCNTIDRQIYEHYFLFPQNYIAIDLQENSNRFASHYSDKEKYDFVNYLDEQASVKDVSKEKMMKYLLDIYANPVRNKCAGGVD
jgi:hypothetical protein